MSKKKYLDEMRLTIEKYKKFTSCMFIFLKGYYTEDQLYLIYENKKLIEKIKIAEEVLKQYLDCKKENYADIKEYFECLQQWMTDFVILLKCHNFKAIQKELLAVCKRKLFIPFIKRRHCKVMLNTLNQEVGCGSIL